MRKGHGSTQGEGDCPQARGVISPGTDLSGTLTSESGPQNCKKVHSDWEAIHSIVLCYNRRTDGYTCEVSKDAGVLVAQGANVCSSEAVWRAARRRR